jgi:hypothetical protein
MNLRNGFFLALIGLVLPLTAAVNETLPSWHWTYAYIDALQARGGFNNLSRLNRPYTRGDVASGLIAMRKADEKRTLHGSGMERRLFIRLCGEFEPEIRVLTGRDTSRQSLEFGLHASEDVTGRSETDTKAEGVYRSRISVPVGNHVVLYNGMDLDQTKADDPLYTGKKWKNLVYYTEQAYFSGIWDRMRIKFGRDFLRWGSGTGGTLLFSDVCRPMDQFTGSFDIGPFRYTFVTSFLDAMSFPSKSADSLDDRRVERYLSAHRLNARLFGGRVEVAVTEAVLYGGLHRPPDWVYMNPFALYHGEQLDRKDQANTLGTLDAFVYPARNWRLNGSLLIDDIQVEKKITDDLEPNEIGWLAGSEWADPFRLSGLAVFGEYVRVANRTYKTPTPWETVVFQDVPIGHPVGNDFDRWTVGFSQWIGSGAFCAVSYGQTRKGEGSLFTPWDAPWKSFTVEQGYSEPFPTGIVETEKRLRISLDYRSESIWGLSGEFQSAQKTNSEHVKGKKSNSTAWRIGIRLDWDKVMHF